MNAEIICGGERIPWPKELIIDVDYQNVSWDEDSDSPYQIIQSVIKKNGLEPIDVVLFLPKVDYIGRYAFNHCDFLKKVYISKGVEEIGKSAFEGCSNLCEVYIPSSIDKVGNDAFKLAGVNDMRCYYENAHKRNSKIEARLRTLGTAPKSVDEADSLDVLLWDGKTMKEANDILKANEKS